MNEAFDSTILVTGSSGYVASDLIVRLKRSHTVLGLDLLPSSNTDLVFDIADTEALICLRKKNLRRLTVINLAAARFDFGVTARDYFKLNVECHRRFLACLGNITVTHFIHISSVASLDGRGIEYTEHLECDDAYRATKYLQEKEIQKWCETKGVKLTIVYPSAIFSDNARSDTNIGKLQSVSKFMPLIPKIEVVKSLTYLPFFSQFITDLAQGDIADGRFLAIEDPSLTVSSLVKIMAGRPTFEIFIPFLPYALKWLAKLLYVVGFFGKFDLKLTPNRVTKLFSDTSYKNIDFKGIDTTTYASRSSEKLPEILTRLGLGE